MAYDPFANDAVQHEAFSGERRWTLPAGLYPMKLVVSQVGISNEWTDKDEHGDEVKGGGKPFVELGSSVIAPYPFSGERINRRLYLSPGAKGAGFHFLRGACAAVTGKTADASAFAKWNVTIPQDGDVKERTAAFVTWFMAASPDDRLAFMVHYLRLKEWNGRSAIVRLGIEKSRTPREDGTYGEYNRYLGFWALDDPTYGRANLGDEAARLAAFESAT